MKKLAVLGAALLVGLGLTVTVGPSAFAAITVHCPASPPNDLQTVMNNAPVGSQIDITGTCIGNFTVPKNLTLVGQAGVLDANQRGTALTVASGVTAVVDYLTIQHSRGLAGLVVDSGGTLTLNAVTVSANNGAAGGISNSGTLTVRGSTISGNGAVGLSGGGGIFNAGGASMTLTSSTVTDNQAVRGNGGGIVNAGSAALTSSTVSGNGALFFAGGILNEGTATMTLTSSKVSDNNAVRAGGGGIDNEGTATITLTTSKVSDNSAGRVGGGGIFNGAGTGSVTLNSSAVTANTPDNCAPPGSVPGCTG
ncbi:MAG: right-handed parallel beta-helix repeat-containing protein [Acidimicrobiia bacterium]|nr:right-handed parallel beta-helix repeat-containing protein [Acidimicrobiia bacterium]